MRGNCLFDHSALYTKGEVGYLIDVIECRNASGSKYILDAHTDIGSWAPAHLSLGEVAYEKVNSGGITIIFTKGIYAIIVSADKNDEIFDSVAKKAESKL
jgi:hypothetical protein